MAPPMSAQQSNIALVREVYDLINARNFEAVSRRVTDDAELEIVHGSLTGQDLYRGPAGWKDYLERLAEVIDDMATEVMRINEGKDCVAAVVRNTGKGRGSGAPYAQAFCHVWTLEGDRVASCRIHRDIKAGRRAAGLDG
jgi:ketosteroid isomerase-like protein